MSLFQTAYGVILNVQGGVEALGDAVNAAPYKAPPKAPVLYIKPRNTFLPGGGLVGVPDGVEALEVQPTLGLLFGRTATRVSEAEAMSCVAGFVPAIDVALPHASVYRPAIRQRCRDGFLPLGTPVAPTAGPVNIRVRINGADAGGFSTADLVRPLPKLIADITDFMTLSPGDVLLVGLGLGSPQAKVGDQVTAELSGVGVVGISLVPEAEISERAA
jgi:5-oxopent-3-ene-1,2,5-tricarboxylate decarboxylase/2-hydroxyhepta-2,4-diene-1,7-dioate isomerase